MKKFVFYAMCLFMSSISMVHASNLETSIETISQNITESLPSNIKKVAVIEFSDLNGYQSSFGQFIAEELITNLSSSKEGGLDVVERRQLSRVLKEQELSESSLFDSDSIAKIGKILGIEAIITGSVTDLGSSVKVNARAISVETAKIFASASSKITKDDVVEGLMFQNTNSSVANTATPSGQLKRKLQKNDVFFQNQFLRAEVASISVSKDKKTASISLVLHNISDKDLILAMQQTPVSGWAGHCSVGVIDNMGNAFTNIKKPQIFGLPCIRNSKDMKKEQFSVLSPKSKTSVVIAAKDYIGQVLMEGNIFSFNASFIRLVKDKPSLFSVGISNIEV